MKLTIGTTKLQDMVARASKGVGNNKLIPITGLICIEVKDNKLTLITTDATNYLYIMDDKFVNDDFYAVVDANMFAKLISKMTCENIVLTVSDGVVAVKGNGNYKIELPLDENGQPIKYPDPFNNDVLAGFCVLNRVEIDIDVTVFLRVLDAVVVVIHGNHVEERLLVFVLIEGIHAVLHAGVHAEEGAVQHDYRVDFVAGSAKLHSGGAAHGMSVGADVFEVDLLEEFILAFVAVPDDGVENEIRVAHADFHPLLSELIFVLDGVLTVGRVNRFLNEGAVDDLGGAVGFISKEGVIGVADAGDDIAVGNQLRVGGIIGLLKAERAV